MEASLYKAASDVQNTDPTPTSKLLLEGTKISHEDPRLLVRTFLSHKPSLLP